MSEVPRKVDGTPEPGDAPDDFSDIFTLGKKGKTYHWHDGKFVSNLHRDMAIEHADLIRNGLTGTEETTPIRIDLANVETVARESIARGDEADLLEVKQDLIELIKNSHEREGWSSDVTILVERLEDVLHTIESVRLKQGVAASDNQPPNALSAVIPVTAALDSESSVPEESAEDDQDYIPLDFESEARVTIRERWKKLGAVVLRRHFRF